MPLVKSSGFLSDGSFSRVLSRGGEFCGEMVTAACPAVRAGGGGWKNGLGPLCRAGGAQHPRGIFTSWWSLICLCHWWGEAKTTPSRIALLLEVVCTKPPVIGLAWLEEL